MDITRVCDKCNVEKKISEFSKHKRCQLGRTWTCIPCKRQYNKEHYKKTRLPGHVSRFQQSKTRGINQAKLHKAKSAGCQICGFNQSIVAIDMHHVEEKEFELSNNINRSEESFDKELAKCVPLCSNCHRMLHAGIIFLRSAVDSGR